MTREEAIARIKEHKIAHKMNELRAIYISEALDMAIEALQQGDILDKIRTEIDNINLNEVALKYENRFYGFQREVIKIIDKYAAESEDK